MTRLATIVCIKLKRLWVKSKLKISFIVFCFNSVDFFFYSYFDFFQEPCNQMGGQDIQFFGIKDQGEWNELFLQPFCRRLPFHRKRFVSLKYFYI